MARAAAALVALAAVAHALPHTTQTKRADAFTRQGCFVDNANNQRLLDASHYADDAMTVETCAAFCSKNKYFGLEYGRECYCADSLSTSPVADSDCSSACSGDASEKCGAKDRLDVYLNNGYKPRQPATLAVPYQGCFVDQGARALPDNLLGADDMTAEKCAAHCANYSYFGVEYGRECWCGNSPPKTPAPESDCSFGCAGDDAQLCGAGNRINVWGEALASPATVGEYEYVGCFTDNRDARSLRGTASFDPAMTLEKCAASCADYAYFGVEFGTQCYCGTALDDAARQVSQAECSLRCGGDYANVCGDADRLNVFLSTDCKPDPASPATVAGFTYQSCWADKTASNGARVLTGKELRADDMTVEKCAATCQGFAYFGVEYARECYCGNDLAGAAAPEAECSQVCVGDATEWCGAPDRLNLYAATPSTPTAAAPTVTVTPV